MIRASFVLTLIFLGGMSLPSAAQNGRVVSHKNFTSNFIGKRRVDVWLPEGYSSTIKYPVVYMHDGQMLFDSTTTWNKQEWMVDETASRLIREGKVPPFIVVGVHNGGSLRRSEYFPEKALQTLYLRDSVVKYFLAERPRAEDYLSFLTTELKPFIDSAYSTRKDKGATFIAGSSMGGLISLYALCRYPQVFGGAACISTHWPGIGGPYSDSVALSLLRFMDENLPFKTDHRLYFDRGNQTLDSLYGPWQDRADAILRNRGYIGRFTSPVFAGHDHSERYWSQRLDQPFIYLLSPLKK